MQHPTNIRETEKNSPGKKRGDEDRLAKNMSIRDQQKRWCRIISLLIGGGTMLLAGCSWVTGEQDIALGTMAQELEKGIPLNSAQQATALNLPGTSTRGPQT